jgi:hypothetical protein
VTRLGRPFGDEPLLDADNGDRLAMPVILFYEAKVQEATAILPFDTQIMKTYVFKKK